jgi:D-alanine-D-alanine ligase
MNRLTIALLSGGTSSERDISLHGGDQVFAALDKARYNVVRFDPKTDLKRLLEEAPSIDAALIILHGPYGEDGTIQGLLDLIGIPYQGSGVLGSALAMNKVVSKQVYEAAGLPIPSYEVVERDDARPYGEYIDRLGLPLVIKPVQGGSSIGMSIVKEESALRAAVDDAFKWSDTVMVEEYIDGTELTGGILGNKHLEALPIIEIIPDKAYGFFDYTAKYTPGATQEICPARISDALSEKAKAYAEIAHKALCCEDYSRTDMILKDDDIYVLETNTIPGMTPTSLLPQAAQAAGFSFSRLLDRLIELSLERHESRKAGLDNA